MILILSAEDDGHVAAVTPKLDARGAKYHWFDPARFPAESEVRLAYEATGLVRGVLDHGRRAIDLRSVTAVWERRPGVPVAAPEVTDGAHRAWIARESDYCLSGVWESLDCRWVPGKPSAIAAAQNKVRLLGVAAAIGFSIPRTRITNSPREFLDFYAACRGRIVTKVLRDGLVRQGGDFYAAYTHPVGRRHAARYRSVRYVPLIVQEYVPKRVELRITVVGTSVFTAEIDSQASRSTRHDWRHYDNDRAKYSVHALPRAVERLCLRLVQALNLTFGAIDMVVTPGGEYVFLEINPSGQWSWIESLTGLPISTAIADLLVQRPARRVQRARHAARV
jgi:glutathione synthase/RimK-type ligase-like ATP-grasp enzyme